MPSLVWIANPPFTPGSQATIVLFIGFGVLRFDGERVAYIDPCDNAQWHQHGHTNDCDDGVHRLGIILPMIAPASLKRIFSGFFTPSLRIS